MNMIFRMLGRLPKHSITPALAALAAWYVGAKYGAPDMYVGAIDGVLAQAGDLLSGVAGGEDSGATTADG